MTWTSRVVWREGMFLRPQHFQQQDRYLHQLLESRVLPLRAYSWGVVDLEIDHAALGGGIIRVNRCKGIFDDGAAFELSAGDEANPSLEITGDAAGMVVYLVVLRARIGVSEIKEAGADGAPHARQASNSWEVGDSNADTQDKAILEVSDLQLRLVLERDRLSDDTSIGLVRIAQVEDDGVISLDDNYVPPCLDCNALAPIQNIITEIKTQLRVRAEYLVGRVTEGERGGVAEVGKYLLLQLVNRYKPLFEHFSELPGLHPLDLFHVLIELAGELSTFSPEGRLAPTFPTYRHDRIAETFGPVVTVIQRELSRVPDEIANKIPLKSDQFGFHVGKISGIAMDPSVTFVLAAKADMPAENLRREFPPQVTVGSPQKISELVKAHMPGLGLFPLQATPAQIPIHAGYTYFQLEQTGAQWDMVAEAKAIALHTPNVFPSLALTLWSIRS